MRYHNEYWLVMQVQCISHFLQLPIEDEFMPDLGRPQGASAPPPAPEPTPQLPSGQPIWTALSHGCCEIVQCSSESDSGLI